MDTRVISHKVSCTHLLESRVSEGVEKKEGYREAGHAFVACSCFYEGLALHQLAESGHDVVETSLGAPPQASRWHPR